MSEIKNTFYTKNEIEGQPDLWVKTQKALKNTDYLSDFLSKLKKKESLNIVLTGAGTSAYIGETTEHLFRSDNRVTALAVSTTTLVTHFDHFIDTSTPLLLISFARSGNSPESIATINLAESRCEEVYHIALTCNPEGQLARRIDQLQNGITILLPPDSDDKGLAMTGSFTSMMLSSIFLAHKWNGNTIVENCIEQVSKSAKKAIIKCAPQLKALSAKKFNRMVFLGSGPLQGIAKESQLKLQELTDGHIVGMFESFLGFRHGPKVVINENTVLVFLFSSDDSIFQYEKDLVDEILEDGIAMHCIGVFCKQDQADRVDIDQKIVFDLEESALYSDYNLLLYVLPAQIIGFYKSLYLGLNPDSPSQNNVISRVVKGVKIYPE